MGQLNWVTAVKLGHSLRLSYVTAVHATRSDARQTLTRVVHKGAHQCLGRLGDKKSGVNVAVFNTAKGLKMSY